MIRRRSPKRGRLGGFGGVADPRLSNPARAGRALRSGGELGLSLPPLPIAGSFAGGLATYLFDVAVALPLALVLSLAAIEVVRDPAVDDAPFLVNEVVLVGVPFLARHGRLLGKVSSRLQLAQ